MAEITPSVTVRLSQDEFLRIMSGWSREEIAAFETARNARDILDVGSDADQLDGPVRTIIGPKKVIDKLFLSTD